MSVPPLSDLVFSVIVQIPIFHFRVRENADMTAFLIFQCLGIALFREIQPHSISLVTNRGIVGQDMEDNHVPGIFVKPGQIHVVMPFVILSTGTDSP